MDDKCAILIRTEHLAQEAKAGRALLGEKAALADAGIDQDPEGERQSGLLREIADDLRAAVFFEDEIVLGQVVDRAALGIVNAGKKIDDANAGGEGSDLLGAKQRR